MGLAVLSESAVSSVLPYLALAAGRTVMAIGTPAARALPPTLVPGRAAAQRDDAAFHRLAVRAGARPGPGRRAVRRLARAGLRSRRWPVPARVGVRDHDPGTAGRGGRRDRNAGLAPARERAGGAAVRRADPDAARRDPARPARRSVRRRRGAAAGFRPVDPACWPGGPRHPARRAGRGRAGRGRGTDPQAAGRRAGHRLLLVVALFGGSIIVFGLSRIFALSLVMLPSAASRT